MFHPLHSVSRLQNLLIPDKNDKILNIFNFLFGDIFQYTLNNMEIEGVGIICLLRLSVTEVRAMHSFSLDG